MFETFFRKLQIVVSDPSIRNRVLFTIGALALFRLLATVPIPGVNLVALENLFSQNAFLGLLNIFSGGGLSKLSIVMLGVGPYITASIIMQLLTVLSPTLKQVYQEEGDAGRQRFTQWSRILTIPLAFMQASAFLLLLRQEGVLLQLTTLGLVANIFVVAAGSIFLMWLGEIITEFGIGNGMSLLIFAGIISAIPGSISQLLFTFDVSQIPVYIALTIAVILMTAAVVFITEAERPIPITYARRVRGNKVFGGVSTYLPLRVNQSGVIPIIFALSILLFPQMIAQFLARANIAHVSYGAQKVVAFLSNTWVYGIAYFLLVFVFTYFYTAITFEPNQVAKNLQKNGAFIPGVRPGNTTAEYLGNIITRITLVGALFLGFIAVMPIILQGITGITALTIGGTALLIVVSVVLDVVKKIDAQTSIREY
jgi:preprotein translocase subunit SecY